MLMSGMNIGHFAHVDDGKCSKHRQILEDTRRYETHCLFRRQTGKLQGFPHLDRDARTDLIATSGRSNIWIKERGLGEENSIRRLRRWTQIWLTGFLLRPEGFYG